ncbi:DUF2809 domain-containing protein [Winogradskyella sp. A3E31]|uniref:ribosomal maturation YjgA family protein n=1 Tax=Winogradskyella sp. A3E31 TaxID=3349637 RepID=UPI00398AE66F
MKLKLNKTYLIISCVLLIIEISIALYLKTGFIRHTFGDFIAVILVYTFIKSFTDISVKATAIISLFIAFSIEAVQYFSLIKWMNLEDNSLAKLVLGTTFQFADLLAYTLGICTVLIIEYKLWKH